MSLENKMIRNGVVVSNKADKTVVVVVERKFQLNSPNFYNL